MKDFGVKLIKDIFFKRGDEGKIVFADDVARNEHSKKIIMINLNQLLDQVYFFIYYAVLKNYYIVVRVNFSDKHFPFYYSYFTKFI